MANVSLKLCTYNCCSLKKNIEMVRNLTSLGYDIIFLQETFVTDDKLGILDYVDENYDCVGVGATYSDKSVLSAAGRPEGGMAILWKKDLHMKINKVSLEKNIMVFNITFFGYNVVFINVYLNSHVWEASTLNRYLETLSRIEHFISSLQYDNIILLGDFNADPFSGRTWRNLSEFMNTNYLHCFDVEKLENDTCTFFGYGNSVTKWLDHVIGKEHNFIQVENLKTLQDILGSDHVPLEATLKFTGGRGASAVRAHTALSDKVQTVINWDKLNEEELNDIIQMVDKRLQGFYSLPIHDCHSTGCRQLKHMKMIDNLYELITTSIQSASQKYLRSSVKKNKFKVIPGWNRCVKQKHCVAREKFLRWVKCGKIRGSIQYQEMLTSRSEFKQALNECKINEHKEICNSIMDKFSIKNKNKFWNEVKKKRNHNKMSSVIDGQSGDSNINYVFYEKFLLNQPPNNPDFEKILFNELKDIWPERRKMHLRVSGNTLKKIILRINSGQGHDMIHTVFLRNTSQSFLENLAHFFNACFIHCYLPGNLLKGTITPIIKDSRNNVTESSNYRPIMQSSCLLKLFELFILDIISEKLCLNFRQLGFKSGSSTTDACFILKEIIKKYTNHKKSAIATFIDLSKAFDRIDHFVLGKKLMNSSLPIDVTFILLHYLRNQKANVRWNDKHSDYYFIEKGVRQGGILSPFLFNFYMLDIINDVVNTNIGCNFGDLRCNILAYADDMVLLAESISDMDFLYNKLCTCIENHSLTINTNKSKCMIFSTKSEEQTRSIELGSDNLEVVESFKYLGHNIRFNFKDSDDIAFRLNNFYASFNSVFRDFKHIDKNTFLFLFNSYCLPEYGLSLWNHDSSFNSCIFKTFVTAFSTAIKRICEVPRYASSHITAARCNRLLLKHHTALVQARYCKRLLRSPNPIIRCNMSDIKAGFFMQYVIKCFKNVYEVNVLEENLDVLTSRIEWVQRHEDRRGPCIFYGY